MSKKRLYIETALIAIGLIGFYVAGFYFIHQMDLAVKAFIMGAVK